MKLDPFGEALAALAHESWSGWMRYLFDKARKVTEPDGRIAAVIPADSCDRWLRQMMTDYAELPEEEKESDRKEAAKMLEVVRAHLKPLLTSAGGEGKCRGCGETIFWFHHKNKTKSPYTSAGTNHFIDCPEAARFKKKAT